MTSQLPRTQSDRFQNCGNNTGSCPPKAPKDHHWGLTVIDSVWSGMRGMYHWHCYRSMAPDVFMLKDNSLTSFYKIAHKLCSFLTWSVQMKKKDKLKMWCLQWSHNGWLARELHYFFHMPIFKIWQNECLSTEFYQFGTALKFILDMKFQIRKKKSVNVFWKHNTKCSIMFLLNCISDLVHWIFSLLPFKIKQKLLTVILQF